MKKDFPKLRHWRLYKKEIAAAKKSKKSYRTAEEMFADIFKKRTTKNSG